MQTTEETTAPAKLDYLIHLEIQNAEYYRVETHGHCKPNEKGVHLNREKEITFEANAACTVRFKNPNFFSPPTGKIELKPDNNFTCKLDVRATGDPEERCEYWVENKTNKPAPRSTASTPTDAFAAPMMNSGDPDPIIQP
jgi:hypothetical protein